MPKHLCIWRYESISAMFWNHFVTPKKEEKHMKNDIHETGAQRGVELAESVHENSRIADDILIGR